MAPVVQKKKPKETNTTMTKTQKTEKKSPGSTPVTLSAHDVGIKQAISQPSPVHLDFQSLKKKKKKKSFRKFVMFWQISKYSDNS